MEVGLTEFGATIAIGVFVFAIGSLTYQYVLGISFPEIKLTNGNTGSTATNAAIAVLIFSLGVLTEDVTDKFKDDFKRHQTPFVTNHFFISSFLQLRSSAAKALQVDTPSDTELRLDTLYPQINKETRNHDNQHKDENLNHNPPPHTVEFRVSHLAADLCRNNVFERFVDSTDFPMDKDLCTATKSVHLDKETRSKLEIEVNRLYYTAKNIVFQTSEYNRELSRIQSRIDFTRSLMMVSPMLFFTVAILLCIAIVFRAIFYTHDFRQKISTVQTSSPKCQTDEGQKNIVSLKSSAALLLALWITGQLSYSAYTHEENEFNKRVFGYFVTLYSLDNDLADTVRNRKSNVAPSTNRPLTRSAPETLSCARSPGSRKTSQAQHPQ